VRDKRVQQNLPLNLEADSPEDVWHDYFSKRSPSPRVVRDIILKLHLEKKHKHVIAAIQAAIIHEESQPWMYEVLALSMKFDKRPQSEIDRALLSQVDFKTDYHSVLYSAAYLTRLGANVLALKMYKQASKREPTRPEPYVMGLKIAQQVKDYDAISWASSGILTTAWTANHQQLHREAEDAATQAQLELKQQGKLQQADRIAQVLREAKVRDLVVLVRWTGNGELDLAVEEPLGTVCSFETPQSRGGGVLVHDGYGPVQSNCHEEYVCAKGASGVYRLKINHVWGNIVGKRAQLTIIRYQGTDRESTRQLTIPLDKSGASVRVALKKGRRIALLHQNFNQPLFAKQKIKRARNLWELVGLADAGTRRIQQNFMNSRKQSSAFQATAQQAGFSSQIGFTPVVTTLSEGATLSAMAVISGDRRYVRITATPVFSTLTDVFTFSFVNNGGNPTGNPGVSGNGN